MGADPPATGRVAYGRGLLETALRTAGRSLDLDAGDLSLRLVPPDRIVISGVEGSVDLSVALTVDGRVLFTPERVVGPDGRDVGLAAPVAARVASASNELAAMLGPVRSVTVEPEQVVVEMAR